MRRLTILLATVAALMLVPAAQAFASGEVFITIEGAGSGEVTSAGAESFPGSPPIECSYTSPGPATGQCEDEPTTSEPFEGIELKAIPSPGSAVKSWEVIGVPIKSSGCNEAGEKCTALAFAGSEAEIEVIVTFAKSAPLTVTKTGNGKGVVESSPTGIECGSICSHEYAEGAEVVLHGIFFEGGSELVKWTGCNSVDGENKCHVTMSAAKNITAEIVLPPKLTISKTGEGTIVSSPAGINCGSECEDTFALNSTVTLTASPATGYAFSAWAGCTEHVGLTCKVKMEKAKTVKVTFVATPSLTIEKAGSGQGKVGASGISCDENCSKASSAVKTGTSVTVKVTPAKGSEAAVFENGTGSASGCSGGTCTFTISADSSVKVKFDPIPTKTLTVNLTGPAKYKGKVTGKGTVKGLTASAINCGAGCTTQTESFFSTDTITLTAVAGTGYTFAGWSGSEAGTCTGTTSPCTISTSANKTLSAEFK